MWIPSDDKRSNCYVVRHHASFIIAESVRQQYTVPLLVSKDQVRTLVFSFYCVVRRHGQNYPDECIDINLGDLEVIEEEGEGLFPTHTQVLVSCLRLRGLFSWHLCSRVLFHCAAEGDGRMDTSARIPLIALPYDNYYRMLCVCYVLSSEPGFGQPCCRPWL